MSLCCAALCPERWKELSNAHFFFLIILSVVNELAPLEYTFFLIDPRLAAAVGFFFFHFQIFSYSLLILMNLGFLFLFTAQSYPTFLSLFFRKLASYSSVGSRLGFSFSLQCQLCSALTCRGPAISRGLFLLCCLRAQIE